jgi:hypothetical protein
MLSIWQIHSNAYLNYLNRWWKETSKSRDHITIKGKQAAQEKSSITPFAITNNGNSAVLHPCSLNHRPETNSRHQTLPNTSTNQPIQHRRHKKRWDSFQWPQNCRIPSPTSSPITHRNWTCSHHCSPQSSFCLCKWGGNPTTPWPGTNWNEKMVRIHQSVA